jgi:hypothetical protein
MYPLHKKKKLEFGEHFLEEYGIKLNRFSNEKVNLIMIRIKVRYYELIL